MTDLQTAAVLAIAIIPALYLFDDIIAASF